MSFNILQLSDLHLSASPHKIFWQQNAYARLSNIINYIKQQKLQPDVLLLTGDLSHDRSCKSYQILADFITSLNIDTYFIAGNHDAKKAMQKTLIAPIFSKDQIIKCPGWLITFLDTTNIFNNFGFAFGCLNSQKLHCLETLIANSHEPNIMIVMHHHPIAVHSPVIDRFILKNNQQFLRILQKYQKNFVIVFGHVHQVFEQQIDNILYLGCPSTAAQLLPGADRLAFDDKPGGFRWIELTPEGINSQVVWVR